MRTAKKHPQQRRNIIAALTRSSKERFPGELCQQLHSILSRWNKFHSRHWTARLQPSLSIKPTPEEGWCSADSPRMGLGRHRASSLPRFSKTDPLTRAQGSHWPPEQGRHHRVPICGQPHGDGRREARAVQEFTAMPPTDSLDGPWKANPPLLCSALRQTDNQNWRGWKKEASDWVWHTQWNPATSPLEISESGNSSNSMATVVVTPFSTATFRKYNRWLLNKKFCC